LKICSKCGEELPLELFEKRKDSADGMRGCCRDCTRKTKQQYRDNNRESVRAQQSKWIENNRQHHNANCKKWADGNRDKTRHFVKSWAIRNRGKRAFTENKRRAAKLNATPVWADLGEILDIYESCPVGHHVDHIIPLQGKNVCGLHVEYNLQHMLAKDNLAKSNKLMEV